MTSTALGTSPCLSSREGQVMQAHSLLIIWSCRQRMWRCARFHGRNLGQSMNHLSALWEAGIASIDSGAWRPQELLSMTARPRRLTLLESRRCSRRSYSSQTVCSAGVGRDDDLCGQSCFPTRYLVADGVRQREGGEFLREALTRRTARLREHGKRQLNEIKKKKRTDNAID